MELLIKFILATAGLTWILCESIIFKKIREKVTELQNKHSIAVEGKKWLGYLLWFPRQLFKCPGCFGFWIGLLNYFLVYVWCLDIVVYPLIGSIVCYILVSLGKYLERKF